ncbi:MAG: NAD(P)-dependent oxidoreductase [Deltaproteobacteria bacterium]|nr:NAD(P)-dependent oxidoreductase [Deltaproteobacteria bacterium]
MRILVTGGTGFTGWALVKRLLEQGHEVVALDYKEGLKPQALRDMGAQVVIGTVTDRAVVDRCMEGVELVHHLAAAFRELNVPESHYDKVNVEGTRNVCDSALKHGVKKLVYCSTCGVHGNVQNPPASENSPIKPADYYQHTKYLGEVVAAEYQKKGLETTILRPAAIYGPGDPERFHMIYKRVKKGWFPMFGDGRTTYHPLYIDNLVDAFLLAAQPGVGVGQAYLIADEHWIEIEELVKKVARAMQKQVTIVHLPFTPLSLAGQVCEKVCRPLGVTPPIFPRRVDWYRQNRAFNIAKAKADLGYSPKVELDEGLANTYRWYQAEGLL